MSESTHKAVDAGRAETAQKWLKVACGFTIGFGLVVGLAAYPATAGATLFLADPIFWPIDSTQSLAAPESRLLCAIVGGVMVG